ncbi:MAG: hypothetical protein HKP53_02195 [Eudoraea sp.]|nr:hypothetical protein [Eudoraea sp.]
MNLDTKDIKNIDSWLQKKGIKYLDVRVELLDHLVTEYEAIDQYPDLQGFLEERLPWCKQVMKKKEKATHWSYQRILWTRFFQLLKKPMIVAFWALFLALVIAMKPVIEWKYKFLFFVPLLASVCAHLYFVLKNSIRKEIFKNVVSAKYLGNIFSLPLLSLYLLSPLLQLNKMLVFTVPFLFLYVMFGTTIYIAAILVFLEKRKVVLNNYDKFLKG